MSDQVKIFFNHTLGLLYPRLLSFKTKKRSEEIILSIAIASFVIHLGLIYLVQFGWLHTSTASSELLRNPIVAIYTPFSFILLYEVYLLIYYLPQSITNYIGKQYEIISLIIIRRLFKDLSSLSFSADWFKINHDLQFTYDLIASVVLFFLIYLFHINSNKRSKSAPAAALEAEEIARFVKIKKLLAAALVPVLIVLAIYSFLSWVLGVVYPDESIAFKNINNIFFAQFFTILIIADVILLLFSFFHTDQFHKVIRNSGFIISTILIRLSFAVDGLINTVMIVSAVIFGLLILLIHNQFEAKAVGDSSHEGE